MNAAITNVTQVIDDGRNDIPNGVRLLSHLNERAHGQHPQYLGNISHCV